MEIDPQKILLPDGFYYPIDTTVCNKFPSNRELPLRIGLDTTINVFYGDCMDPFFGGECVFYDVRETFDVEITEGFEYVRPRVATGDCLENPYNDEDESFTINQYNCFYLKFDKTEPAISQRVKIKFTRDGHNGPEFVNYTFNVIKPEWHIAPTDSFIVLEYGDYWSVYDYEVLTQCNTAWPFLPENAVITKEIVQGSEYGQLWNSYTNEYGNLFNYGDVYLVANGVKPAQDEEIVVRVSTNVAGVAPLDITYIVRPVDLEITVSPPTILAGDTATIFIQKKYLDGTVSDFDEWQTFEIAKIEGCELGEILVDGETRAYFTDVYQPIHFVADSLAESGTVKLKIGVLKYPSFATRPVVLNNTPPVQTEQSQIITNDNNSESTITENQTNPPSDNPLLSCALEPVESVLNEDVGVVVGDECENLNSCSGDNADKKPSINVLDFPNGYNNHNHCGKDLDGMILGYFTPLWSQADQFLWWYYNEEDLFLDFTVEACYKDNIVQFSIGNNNILNLKTIVGFCDGEIATKFKEIKDPSEISTKIPQNESELLKAFNDFELLRTYGGGYLGMYYPSLVVWKHEYKHFNNFKEQVLNPVLNSSNDIKYSVFNMLCSEIADMEDAKVEFKEIYKEKLDDFEVELFKKYIKQVGRTDQNATKYERETARWNENENTHNTKEVQQVITDYQDVIDDILYELQNN